MLKRTKPSIAGQAITEYALFLAVVIAAFTTMQLYTRRAIQAGVKNAADRLSPCNVENPSFRNPTCEGVSDNDGEIAQNMGIRNETGDQKFQLNAQGRILESNSRYVVLNFPENNFTRRTETIGGAVALSRQSSTTTVGSSRRVVVTHDSASP